MAILNIPAPTDFEQQQLKRTINYPRLRYMGSKYKVVPYLASILNELPFHTVLDAFCGSGVVSYALKEMGKVVTSNDFLTFSSTISKAVVANSNVTLDEQDIHNLTSPNKDGRNFISTTFSGLYFPQEDHEFLDSVWSHLEYLPEYKKELALASLCLAAARKQPRGVFTITDIRYDDGRRTLRTPLRDLFLEAVNEYNRMVFDNGLSHQSTCSDILEVTETEYDLVYFDPPYAPPRDDADYIKRYHFLEGLSVYWQGLEIMENTKSKKIPKRYTPFAYKRSVREALLSLFHKFKDSIIVLSYSSNSFPSEKELYAIMKQVKSDVQVFSVPHTYSFGTHAKSIRRKVQEYIFVAR